MRNYVLCLEVVVVLYICLESGYVYHGVPSIAMSAHCATCHAPQLCHVSPCAMFYIALLSSSGCNSTCTGWHSSDGHAFRAFATTPAICLFGIIFCSMSLRDRCLQHVSLGSLSATCLFGITLWCAAGVAKTTTLQCAAVVAKTINGKGKLRV